MTIIQGVIHGRTIELQEESGLPDGQTVAVTIQRIEQPSAPARPGHIPPVESWMDRLIFDSTVHPTERIVKGTSLQVEALVAELEPGRTDDQILQAHPELAKEDVAALRNYARWPIGLRRSCGAWSEEAEEVDKYLEWTRQHRKISRREIPD
jgi:uncharacterized protein (DUF433 family)